MTSPSPRPAPRRRYALPAAATLVALGLTALPAGASGSPGALRADAEKVEFGASGQEAPELTTGIYEVPAPQVEEEAFLAVRRTVDGSTLWLGETLLSDGGQNGSMYLSPSVTGTGSECGDGVNFEGDDYRGHRFMTGVLTATGPCSRSDAAVFAHRAYAGDASFPAGKPLQVVAWEEPPVEDPSVLPPPSTAVQWTGNELPAEGKAELGTTYDEAPDLTGGRWDVHVDPGVPALFRVPLDWNQHVEVSLSYGGREFTDYIPVEPVLITPLGGRADWATTQGEDAPEFPDVNLGYPGMDGGVVSPSITWRNREKPSENPAAFPGMYYVLLQLGTKDAPKAGADITVGVDVITDREPDSPYAEEGDPAPDIGGHVEDVEESSGDEGGDGGGSSAAAAGGTTPWGSVTALFGGSAVFAAAGAVLLGRYRRAGA